MTTAFETEVCSRCGGTGRFSHNGEHDRCYKCDGKNGARAYTKRGKAAKEYYLAKFHVPASTIVPGDLVSSCRIKIRVVEIERGTRVVRINGAEKVVAVVTLKGENVSLETAHDATVRRFPTPEENAAAIADALAYQATLTKAGTPRKRG